MPSRFSAERCGAKHIRFMGTQKGVLAVQAKRENDLPCPIPWKPCSWWGTKELKHDPGNPEAGDPEVIAAVIDALKRETLGGSFIQLEYEKECRALLRGPVLRVSLFVHDPDWLNKPPPGGWQYLSTAWADDCDNMEIGGGSTEFGYASGVPELLAGGGFQIVKP